MFKISKETILDEALLSKMFNKFQLETFPKLQKYKNYYDGLQDIKNKSYADESKVCNRAVTNFTKDITDSYCGYIATPGYITYSSTDDIGEIMDILKYNDYQTEDSDFLFNALVYGYAAELMYLDGAQVRFKQIEPTQCFGVFDDTLTNDMLYFVRFYKTNEWDMSNNFTIEVYNNETINYYSMNGWLGQISFIGSQLHHFSQVPANVFYLSDERSIFDCIIDLQDAYNIVTNDELDDYGSFIDAYLTLTGAELDTEDAKNMRENRLLMLPEGAEAKWLTKNSSDVQVENIVSRLQKSIYRIAKCPDFSDTNFAGVSSGIALRYKLCGMENRAGKIVAQMKKALQRRIELICSYSAMLLGENIFRDINIEFKRNIPDDINDTVNVVTRLRGIVSDKTLLSQVPFVNDVDKEIEQKEEQNSNIIDSVYNFNSNDEE